MKTCLKTDSAVAGVRRADGHKGCNHSIGGVAGYEDHLSVSGVGYNIAAGTRRSAHIGFGLGRADGNRVDDPLFESEPWAAAGKMDSRQTAREELGIVAAATITWTSSARTRALSGSGGISARATSGTRTPPGISRPPRSSTTCRLPALLRADSPAAECDDAAILRALPGRRSACALHSTVHGAGQVMPRTEAKDDRKSGRVFKAPRIDAVEMRDWLSRRDVMLLGGDLDETPQAHRRPPGVQAELAGLIGAEHVPHPSAVVMAGPADAKPYKD